MVRASFGTRASTRWVADHEVVQSSSKETTNMNRHKTGCSGCKNCNGGASRGGRCPGPCDKNCKCPKKCPPAQSCLCPPGPQGPRGLTGATGPRGPAGPAGSNAVGEAGGLLTFSGMLALAAEGTPIPAGGSISTCLANGGALGTIVGGLIVAPTPLQIPPNYPLADATLFEDLAVRIGTLLGPLPTELPPGLALRVEFRCQGTAEGPAVIFPAGTDAGTIGVSRDQAVCGPNEFFDLCATLVNTTPLPIAVDLQIPISATIKASVL